MYERGGRLKVKLTFSFKQETRGALHLEKTNFRKRPWTRVQVPVNYYFVDEAFK
jgi:hypothetical protein